MINYNAKAKLNDEDGKIVFENEKQKESKKDISKLVANHYLNKTNGLWSGYNRHARKIALRKKIDESVDEFTVHGLKKVFTGSKAEKLFWFLTILAGLMLSVFITKGLVIKYYKYEVYTEIRAQITDKNYFPSVTFCEYQLLKEAYFSYCGTPQHVPHKNYDTICTHKEHFPHEDIIYKSGAFWSNGIFNITRCNTWGGKYCADSSHFKSLHHFNHSCVTWNYKGDFHDIYSHADIEFKFIKSDISQNEPLIIALAHDPGIHEVDITKKVDIELNKYYELRLDKTFIKRLPFPYPSNCTNDKKGDIFPGKYARRNCIESYNHIEMYKLCGDTLDYVRKFIPYDILKEHQRNRTIREVLSCMRKYGEQETKRVDACAFPCTELDIGTVATFHERKRSKEDDTISYHVGVQYVRVDTFNIMEEKMLYTWDQMACEIGGFVGLVIGASIISLIEILAYILMVICNAFL